MIAADADLLTYAQAGKLIGKSARFIAKRVKDGDLVGTDLGYHCKRISRLDWLNYLNQSRTVERTTGRK